MAQITSVETGRVNDPALRFRMLAARWRETTLDYSSTSKIVLDESYQQIIGLGPVAIPLILNELRRRPEHWYHALRALTGENPVSPATQGDVEAMRQAWLQWGREHGYLES